MDRHGMEGLVDWLVIELLSHVIHAQVSRPGCVKHLRILRLECLDEGGVTHLDTRLMVEEKACLREVQGAHEGDLIIDDVEL